MPPTWNNGILEEWNNGLKTHNFSVWIKVFRINFHSFSIIVLISARDDHPFVALMAFPNKMLSLIRLSHES
jgi:hypothetical protein